MKVLGGGRRRGSVFVKDGPWGNIMMVRMRKQAPGRRLRDSARERRGSGENGGGKCDFLASTFLDFWRQGYLIMR